MFLLGQHSERQEQVPAFLIIRSLTTVLVRSRLTNVFSGVLALCFEGRDLVRLCRRK